MVLVRPVALQFLKPICTQNHSFGLGCSYLSEFSKLVLFFFFLGPGLGSWGVLDKRLVVCALEAYNLMMDHFQRVITDHFGVTPATGSWRPVIH